MTAIETVRPEMSDEAKAHYLVVDHLSTEYVREIIFREGTPEAFQRRIADCFTQHGFQTEISANRLIVSHKTSLEATVE